MHHHKFVAVAATITLAFAAGEVGAQATGGVFGPVVNEGHRSMQYRSAYDPDSCGFAQRLHYQQSIDS